MSNVSHIIFIHGLSNKPPLQDLRRIWLDALAETRENNPGFDLGTVGVKASFIYWADLFYDNPLPTGSYESSSDEIEASVVDEVELAGDEWTAAMLEHFPMDEGEVFEDAAYDQNSDYERIPLPWFVKKKIIKHFLREAHDYLFNVDGVKDIIRKRVLDIINEANNSGEKVILAGHSQGAIIAYDVLTGAADCPLIDGLMTFGSPLGIDEVQDKLTWNRENGFPEKLQGSWINVYDSFDVVSGADPKHANDFKKDGIEVVIDVNENSWGKWRHSATKYLKGSALRKHLRQFTNRA